MDGIDLPITLDEPEIVHPVHARADVHVDLPDPAIKGIHMSRLYRLLDGFAERERLRPATLSALLAEMVSSHADCHSTRARVVLNFSVLCRRPALLTEGLSGWKSYPVRLEAFWSESGFSLDASVQIGYSSTCPCSAALARQLIEQAFIDRFGPSGYVESAAIAAWLRQHATLATPHSQRSLAEVRVRIPDGAVALGLIA